VTRLGDAVFPDAAARRSTLSLLGWWESRRGFYNLAVGGTGLVVLLVIRLITLIPPGMPMGPGLIRPVIAYGFMANVCYTFGWVAESVAQRIWGDKVRPLGPVLFRQGLAFSVGLTMLPILFVSIGWLVRVAGLLLR
jgi:hypothetical protein